MVIDVLQREKPNLFVEPVVAAETSQIVQPESLVGLAVQHGKFLTRSEIISASQAACNEISSISMQRMPPRGSVEVVLLRSERAIVRDLVLGRSEPSGTNDEVGPCGEGQVQLLYRM